jgi:DNA-binding HxlR family transcriptional regulator
MKHKSLAGMPCPIARSLHRVGEWWSILIMRDALHGYTRFDQFQTSLGIAPNMLTRRLDALVEAGLLERRRYSEHPPRDEYIPTSRGRDFPAGADRFPRLGQQAFCAGGRVRLAGRWSDRQSRRSNLC